MSADGKISDVTRSPLPLGSKIDKSHLEQQVFLADGVLFGAGTLRAGGTAMRIIAPQLIQQRKQLGKPPQPVQILCSRSGEINPQLPFFQQPVPRWLLTTRHGSCKWEQRPEFEKILVFENPPSKSKSDNPSVDFTAALQHLATLGLKRVAVLGGGELIASLLAANLIDEFWLTVCPLILGGDKAPTPVDGAGFLIQQAPRLELVEVKQVEHELFLHYRLQR
ncbi:MAG TPA: RibD family protein [Oscillatoriaceae cyanobacterium M7585_C2015_266]|nr:RibD family protein [Oscillatoriaceae cyanobacterium M7585_C2015_266]